MTSDAHEKGADLTRRGALLAEIFESAPLGLCTSDRRGRFITVNRALTRFLERSVEELRTLTFSEVTHPDDLEASRALVAAITAGELEQGHIEKRYVTGGGDIRWGLTWLQPVRDEGGAISSLVAVVQDITERKDAEERLLRSERKYRELTEALPVTVFETDLAGQLLYVNRDGYERFGYDLDQPLEQLNLFQLIAPEERPRAAERIAKLRQGQRLEPIEYTAIRKDGSTFPIVIHSRAIERDGVMVGMRGIVVDVSDRRRVEEDRRRLADQLRQAEKMEAVGQLAGGVAHDFNNQLVSILGYADLLRLKTPEGSDLARYADGIIASARRAGDLTERLLSFSRKSEPAMRVIDAHEVIDELVGLLRRSLDPRIRVHRRLAAPTALVLGDASQLQNALLNLAINARDALRDGGKIVFRTSVELLNEKLRASQDPPLGDGAHLMIRVSDDGEGMDAETLSRAFEPFFTTKSSRNGTGLGLATVYAAVRRHRGAIEAQSTPGQGTCFTIALPLVDRFAREVGREVAETLSRGARRRRVLVVDDDEIAGYAVAEMATALGHEVTACATVASALETVHEARALFELAVLDLIMPEKNGFELYQDLRRRFPDLTPVFITGHCDSDALESQTRAEGFDVLYKPFTVARLERAIEAALGDRHDC